MKMQKMITLDTELFFELGKLGINVSDECNQHLWTLITDAQDRVKDMRKPEHIDMEIRQLQEQKEDMSKQYLQIEARNKAGISDKLIKFLTSMSTSIMAAKDNKVAYKKITGKNSTWEELKALKKQWT